MPVQLDNSKLGKVTLTMAAGGASAITYTFPTGQGANTELLRNDGSGGLAWVANNGLGSGMGSALLTTGAGATDNISILYPYPVSLGGSTDMSLSFLPQTSPTAGGTWQAQVADATTTGGNTRGSPAFDFQKSRTAASQVASGQYSIILGGANNTAAAGQSVVAGGFSNTVASLFANSAIMGGSGNSISGGSTSSAYCLILGGSGNSISPTGAATATTGAMILGGLNNTGGGDYSSILGGYGQQGRGYIAAMIFPTANPLGLSSTNSLCQALYMGQSVTSATTVGTFALTSSNTAGTVSAFNTLATSNNATNFIFGYVLGGRGNGQAAQLWSYDMLVRKAATAASITNIGGSGPTIISGTGSNISTLAKVMNTGQGTATLTIQLTSSVSTTATGFSFSCEVTY